MVVVAQVILSGEQVEEPRIQKHSNDLDYRTETFSSLTNNHHSHEIDLNARIASISKLLASISVSQRRIGQQGESAKVLACVEEMLSQLDQEVQKGDYQSAGHLVRPSIHLAPQLGASLCIIVTLALLLTKPFVGCV